jgi:hypothetical protein
MSTSGVLVVFGMLQVNGDVFLGRYMDNEEDFERMDFTTADLSSAAPWIADAQRQIARRGERSGDSQALLQRLQQQQQQPAAGGSGSSSKAAASPADAAKARGNEVGNSWAPERVVPPRTVCVHCLLHWLVSACSA